VANCCPSTATVGRLCPWHARDEHVSTVTGAWWNVRTGHARNPSVCRARRPNQHFFCPNTKLKWALYNCRCFTLPLHCLYTAAAAGRTPAHGGLAAAATGLYTRNPMACVRTVIVKKNQQTRRARPCFARGTEEIQHQSCNFQCHVDLNSYGFHLVSR
jgi:hypothetical protein